VAIRIRHQQVAQGSPEAMVLDRLGILQDMQLDLVGLDMIMDTQMRNDSFRLAPVVEQS
jgi:hypothetical protein